MAHKVTSQQLICVPTGFGRKYLEIVLQKKVLGMKGLKKYDKLP